MQNTRHSGIEVSKKSKRSSDKKLIFSTMPKAYTYQNWIQKNIWSRENFQSFCKNSMLNLHPIYINETLNLSFSWKTLDQNFFWNLFWNHQTIYIPNINRFSAPFEKLPLTNCDRDLPSLASHECQPVDDDSLAPGTRDWLGNLLILSILLATEMDWRSWR